MGNSASTTAEAPPPMPRVLRSVVSYDEFQRAVRGRAESFAKMAQCVTPGDVQRAKESLIVAKNFKVLMQIPAPGDPWYGSAGGGSSSTDPNELTGLSYEVRCIGDGHPELFRDQCYVLKAIFRNGLGTRSNQNASLENEYLVPTTLAPHPNISQYFCQFTDRIPLEGYGYPSRYGLEILRAVDWVVHDFNPVGLRQLLSHHNSPTALESGVAFTPMTTTPWPIIHKYSRDICAALVHLFVNQTILFDITLDNIVLSSNKEQAILIDIDRAIKFPRTENMAFETEAASLISVLGNQSHAAPEIVTGMGQYRANPDRSLILCCDKQPSFALGCLLFEIAMCGQHPLPKYPAGSYWLDGKITFPFESLKPPAFPKEFCNLVGSLLKCDPEERMPLLEASDVLSNIDPPCSGDLLSFYSYVAPHLTNDAGALTAKATYQILYGGSATECIGTLHKALQLEPLFSPALLLLHYLNSACSACDYDTNKKWYFHQQRILGALTGKTATFTTSDDEFLRTTITKTNRSTLPEMVLTALWTRHISHQTDDFHNATQLILQKAPTAALHRWHRAQTLSQFSALACRFLRHVIHTRNEMMMEALSQLELGSIDSALDLVADATFLFGCEMKMNNFDRETSLEQKSHECEYLPGLLFLCCLRCVINDHVALHRRIPSGLSLAFSCSLSAAEEMKAHCLDVLSNETAATFESEWIDLVKTAETKGQVDQQVSPTTATEENQRPSPACMYYVGLWRTLCSDNNRSASESAAHIWEKMSSGMFSTCDPHSISSATVQIQWSASALLRVGVCSHLGVGGVGKDMGKAVSIYKQAADAGDATATYNLGMCYFEGDGVERDMRKAVTLFQRAADAGKTTAMCNLGVCYQKGTGVDMDIHKAVSLFQRAADAGDARAMCNLAVLYHCGTGVARDTGKAISLLQLAVDACDATAMSNLAVCYEQGRGVNRDIDKAVELYSRAARLGKDCAVFRLRELTALQQSQGRSGQWWENKVVHE
ncbi:sel1 repeat family protein [Pelomyxa schiedti]|nr:sel1 repeat family protein [Pelomyxa schiedti]